MRLIEAAQVHVPRAVDAPAEWPGNDVRFAAGPFDVDEQGAAVQASIVAVCPPEGGAPMADGIPLINTPDPLNRPHTYHVVPFGIEADLFRSVMCSSPDDPAWLTAVMNEQITALAVARALVIQTDPANESWIGHPDVRFVALADDATPAALAAAIAEAYRVWTTTVVEVGGPILHVPASMAPRLVAAGIMAASPEGSPQATVFGTPVVVDPGYDTGDAGTTRVFWTGPVHVGVTDLLTPDDMVIRHARTNQEVIVGQRIAAVGVSPRMIVRVGGYAAT